MSTVNNRKLYLSDDLNEYYIPCKGKKYLTDLDEKKAITILRQIVKCFNYLFFQKKNILREKI